MKILMITPWPAFAHAVRLCSVAQHLKSKSIFIIFAAPQTSALAQMANESNFPFIPISSQIAPIKRYEYNPYTVQTAEYDFKQVHQLLNEIKPNLILSDAHPLMPLVAEKSKICHAALVSAVWTNYYAGSRYIYKWSFVRNFLGPKGEQLFRIVWSQIFFHRLRTRAGPIVSLAKKHGLTSPNNLLQLSQGQNLTFITDHPLLGPLNNPPRSFYYSGPIFWEPKFRSHKLQQKIDKNKKNIYVTFGSSGVFYLLERITNWLLESGYHIVLSSSFISKTKAWPCFLNQEGVVSSEFINVQDILPYCQAAIYHGGEGTMYQLLKYKIPSIAIPRHWEQSWTAHRTQDLGVGKILPPRQASKKRLLNLLQTVIKQSESVFDTHPLFVNSELENLNGAVNTAKMILEHAPYTSKK